MLTLVLLAAIFIVVVVLLYRAKYLVIAAKGGLGTLLIFCLACFAYGLVKGFEFYHGYAPPGFEAAWTTALFFGFAFGPFVLFFSGLITVAIVYAKRRLEKE